MRTYRLSFVRMWRISSKWCMCTCSSCTASEGWIVSYLFKDAMMLTFFISSNIVPKDIWLFLVVSYKHIKNHSYTVITYSYCVNSKLNKILCIQGFPPCRLPVEINSSGIMRCKYYCKIFCVVCIISNGPSSSFYRKFVKEQKQVQEDISRMSSKAITKVQDDIKSLKQLLSVNASGLQRQALAIDKLKLETAQVNAQ